MSAANHLFLLILPFRSTVINAHANSCTPKSGDNADAILRRMINRYLLGDKDCKPNAVSFTAAIKAHSSAMNTTLSMLADEDNEQREVEGNYGDVTRNEATHQRITSSAKRCEDLLQQLCLLYQTFGNDRSLKPTPVTFDLVTRALTQVEDREGVARVKALRDAVMVRESSRR